MSDRPKRYVQLSLIPVDPMDDPALTTCVGQALKSVANPDGSPGALPPDVDRSKTTESLIIDRVAPKLEAAHKARAEALRAFQSAKDAGQAGVECVRHANAAVTIAAWLSLKTSARAIRTRTPQAMAWARKATFEFCVEVTVRLLDRMTKR